MARRSRKRPWGAPHRELGDFTATFRHSQAGPGGDSYQVQRVGPSDRVYRCPGCNRDIPAGTPHVVAWREESLLGWDSGVEARRHWHEACWGRARHL